MFLGLRRAAVPAIALLFSATNAPSVFAQAPVNDNRAAAIQITGTAGTIAGTTVGATREAGEVDHAGRPGTHSVWYRWRLPNSGVFKLRTVGSSFNPVLAVYIDGGDTTFSVASNDDGNAPPESGVEFYGIRSVNYLIAVDGSTASDQGTFTLEWGSEDPSSTIVSAVLPSARSVTDGTDATAFATILNAGGQTATNCQLGMATGLPIPFSYQTTNTANVPVGVPNTPVDIPAGQGQGFVITQRGVVGVDIALPIVALCNGADFARSVPGVNTFFLTATTTAGPDLVSIAATISNDGIVTVPSGPQVNLGPFAVAVVNIGATGNIVVEVRGDPETFDPPQPTSFDLKICQTDANAACINPATPSNSVTLNIANNQVATFSVFVVLPENTTIPFDPANNRAYVVFRDQVGGTVRGMTSVAVRSNP